MEVWRDYDAAAVNWAMYVDQMNIPELREFFGQKTAWGGFDNRRQGVLYWGTKEEIQMETRRLIDEGTRTGYMLGPDCSLSSDIDFDHIRRVLEEARK